MKSKLSASIMCADPLYMKKDLDALAQKGIDFFHCDVMDGQFVPNLMLSTETLKAVKQQYQVPLDIHIMAEKPEHVLPWLPFGKGDIVSIHYESTPHVDRVLQQIAEKEAMPALALNPATPLACAAHVLDRIGMLLIMTVNPGFAGQKMVPCALEKIRMARKLLDEAGYSHILLEVDGNCSLENIPLMEEAGADTFVVGTSSVFSKVHGLEKGLAMTRACLKK
ncbi:MAG: ribulose-phosphate 3-epimerase [Clostridiales bacterium]|nr:ribulose-phosphate 3-epimerase [Clostridiales bacterium]